MTRPMSCTSSPRAADVRGHQVPHGPAAKLRECGSSFALGHLAVEATCREASPRKAPRRAGRVSVRVRTNSKVFFFWIAKQHIDGCAKSIGLAYPHQNVLDVGVGFAKHRSLPPRQDLAEAGRRVSRHRVETSQTPGGFCVPRGAYPRIPSSSSSKFMSRHFVCFVERDGLKLLERHGSGAQMIEKAAGGADDDLGKHL